MTTTVLAGGRVVDPRSGTEAIADVRIDGDRIGAVGSGLQGDRRIDVSGMVVGPGFVDLHSHVHGVAGLRLQALDGVTTALDLEAGLMPVEKAYAAAATEGRPVNYGFSASWASARGQVLAGVHPDADMLQSMALLGDERWQRSSSTEQLKVWLELLRGEIAAGALGVGILMGYAPRSDPAEYLAVARLAAEAGVPTWTHVRELVEADPTIPIDGPSEVVQAAAETGAHMHHCHVNSTSRRHLDRVQRVLADSIADGARVTVEAYPYGAGSTGVGAAFLAPERLGAWGIGPSNIVLLPSGERIADAGRLAQVRAEAPGTACIVEFLDEDDPSDAALLVQALDFPDTIVASDAMPLLWADGGRDSLEWPMRAGASTHPRTAGTFAKALRRMVRESGRWTWPEAFRRCSLLPAQALAFVPAAAGKGWLGPGADADVVVIDPKRVTDTATYLSPTSPSVGVEHVFVAGAAVVRDGAIVADALPGRPLRASPR